MSIFRDLNYAERELYSLSLLQLGFTGDDFSFLSLHNDKLDKLTVSCIIDVGKIYNDLGLTTQFTRQIIQQEPFNGLSLYQYVLKYKYLGVKKAKFYLSAYKSKLDGKVMEKNND